jgi:hypothetical protein
LKDLKRHHTTISTKIGNNNFLSHTPFQTPQKAIFGLSSVYGSTMLQGEMNDVL